VTVHFGIDASRFIVESSGEIGIGVAFGDVTVCGTDRFSAEGVHHVGISASAQMAVTHDGRGLGQRQFCRTRSSTRSILCTAARINERGVSRMSVPGIKVVPNLVHSHHHVPNYGIVHTGISSRQTC